MSAPAPATVVQRQLDAFNARDLTALLALYADDALLIQHPDTVLRRGAAELRAHFSARFAEPNLHAALLHRAVLGDLVVDHERVTRTFPEGPGTVELVMTYAVSDGRIARAWSVTGPKTLAAPAGGQPPRNPLVSPYEKTGGLVWFPRMLHKIRLHAAGQLPAEFIPYLGRGFDRRCLAFLGVDYPALVARVLAGGTDETLLAWCYTQGHRPTETEVLVWNEYMIKRGWRDTDAPAHALADYKRTYGLAARDDVMTYFDFYEVDEGRRP